MSDQHDKAMTVIERAPERSGMSPVMATALEILRQNPSPETLQKLLDLDRDYQREEAKKAYAAALVGLKSDLPTTVTHDRKVDFNTTHYTYASLSALVEAVTPHLNNHGFVLTWKTSRPHPNEVVVTCHLMHRAGHSETQMASAAPDTKGGKTDAQAFESTCTTLKRQSLLSALGMATAAGEEESEAARPDLDKVDPQRNLRAVGLLKKHGKTRAQAEKFLGGRNVEDWTEADLKKLEAWAKAPGDASAG